MSDSFLDEGFLLAKTPGQNQPRRVENAKSKINWYTIKYETLFL